MEVTFDLADGSGTMSKVLQVDSGATGGSLAFSLSQGTCDLLDTGLAGLLPVTDVSGNTLYRPVVWVWVNLPFLGLWKRVQVLCYPQAPGDFEGLVRLPFLSHYFEKWGGERDATGQWQFCVER
jgi:hypothetical protein